MKNYIIICPMSATAKKIVCFDAKTARWTFTNECIEMRNSGFKGSIDLYIDGKFVKTKVFA